MIKIIEAVAGVSLFLAPFLALYMLQMGKLLPLLINVQ